MTPEDVTRAAEDLFRAEESCAQIGLLSLRHPGMTLDDAYAVQAAFVARKVQAGRRKVGWKIGLTSRAMQDALKIDTPDSGVLLDDMVLDNDGRVPQGRFIQPRVEAEIAFVMGKDLPLGDLTRDDILAATAQVAPALEILDTRILRADPETGQARVVTDTISDTAANAGIVLGAERHDPRGVDLRWAGAIVSRNGEVEETGLGAGVLNDPVTSVLWLARRMETYGQRIEAGDIVLSGSFIRPVECPSGTMIHADFGAFGSVSISFD